MLLEQHRKQLDVSRLKTDCKSGGRRDVAVEQGQQLTILKSSFRLCIHRIIGGTLIVLIIFLALSSLYLHHQSLPPWSRSFQAFERQIDDFSRCS